MHHSLNKKHQTFSYFNFLYYLILHAVGDARLLVNFKPWSKPCRHKQWNEKLTFFHSYSSSSIIFFLYKIMLDRHFLFSLLTSAIISKAGDIFAQSFSFTFYIKSRFQVEDIFNILHALGTFKWTYLIRTSYINATEIETIITFYYCALYFIN